MVRIRITAEQEFRSIKRLPMTFTEYMDEVQNQETKETMSKIYGIENVVRTPEAIEVHVRPEMLMVILGDYSIANHVLMNGG
ncbi:MAG: hypothetical protein LC687_02065 [Actinobacteria bacterium]|nr:hypothetical protein [Actinomycetota bacterium]